MFILFFCSVFAKADDTKYYDAEIDGIFYKFDNKSNEATVVPDAVTSYTNMGDGMITIKSLYSGDVIIPESVIHNGTVFKVTRIIGGVHTYSGRGGAFDNCTGLTSITIPKTIKYIGSDAFKGCTSLSAVYISDLSSWCNIGFAVTNAAESGYRTDANPLSYAHNLYLNKMRIIDLVIPDDITNIKDISFVGCDIISVTLPKNCMSMGDGAFDECNSLKDIICYSSRIEHKTGRFTHVPISNKGSKTLHIRERYKENFASGPLAIVDYGKIEYIQDVDFHLIYTINGEEYKNVWCEVGETIVPLETPTKEGYIFSGWSEIPETMPSHNVTVTGTFSPNVYKLTYKVDGEEYKVVEVKCDETITAESEPTRKGMTFSGWSEIPETMPAKDVEVTGKFSWSQVVKDNVVYEVRDTINNYAVVVDGRDLEGEVTIKSFVEFDGEKYTVNEVAKDAFYWDTNVFTSVVIPDCITTIGSWAFKERKSLKKVEIGSGITSIGKRAFADIDNLETVTIHAENVPETDRTAFENSYLNYVTLYVPASSLGKYKDAAPWNEFKDIVALDEEVDDNLDVITIKDIGKTTYCCEYDLDFTDVEGIKAYTATGYDNIDKTIWLTRVMKVPAGTGILVKGDPGTYKIPHALVQAYYTNMFKGNTGDPIKIEETDGDMTNYYLSGSDGQFKSVSGNANIGKNKAYLQLPTKFFAGTRSIGVTYDDEGTTGIWTIGQGALKSERDVWYNLQGQRVDKPKKGLYIRNGRKVVVR